MVYKRVNGLFLLLIILLLVSCSNNPFDKKLSNTNYIEVLDELEKSDLIVTEDREKMKEKIMFIIVIKDGGSLIPKSSIHAAYGVPYEELTYRHIYNKWCVE